MNTTSTFLQLVHQVHKDLLVKQVFQESLVFQETLVFQESLVLQGYPVFKATLAPLAPPATQDRWEGKDLVDHQGVLDSEVRV